VGGLRKIVFIEVKSGKFGRLSEREREGRKVVERKEVYWEIIHKKEEDLELQE